MEVVREIVSKGLEARQKAGIKIRQPLSDLRFKIYDLGDKELLDLIKGEVNIKSAIFDKNLKDDVELNTEITDELREEGFVREFVRAVQDFRKELKLTPQEKVELSAKGKKEFEKILTKHELLIKKEINISDLLIGKTAGNAKEISLDGEKLEIGINHTHHLKIENA